VSFQPSLEVEIPESLGLRGLQRLAIFKGGHTSSVGSSMPVLSPSIRFDGRILSKILSNLLPSCRRLPSQLLAQCSA
jgi:hypothetical protein